MLSHGNVSKVSRDFSSSSCGSFRGRMPRRETIRSGRGSSYHSIVFNRPCRHNFFSSSFSLCSKSCLTPVTQRLLFTPQRIFFGEDSQHWSSLRETRTLFFRRSTFTESSSHWILGYLVYRFIVVYIEVGPFSSWVSCFVESLVASLLRRPFLLSRRARSCFSETGS